MENFKGQLIYRYETNNGIQRMKNNTTYFFRGILILALSLALANAQAQEEALSRGAVILAEKNEPVTFFGVDNKLIEKGSMLPGVLLPDGASVQTGEGASVLLLLSNGTVVTVSENTRMKISSFVQEPFDDNGLSVGDLNEEPSSSSVLVDLDVGELVVKTKKLNKKSNFEISSPVGTAGIRGTQFGMGYSPRRGMSLDVTESTVSFKPRGGGQPRMVRAGRGLTAPTRGQPVERPVSPIAQGRINQTNDRATRSTNDYSLDYVSKSMEQATQEKPPRKEEDRRNRKEEDQAPDEPGSEDPAPGGKEEAQPDGTEEKQPDQGPVREDGRPESDPERNDQGSIQEKPSRETGNSAALKPEDNRPQAEGGQQAQILTPVAANLPMKTERPRASEILENTPDIEQARKTGKVSKSTKKLAKLALDEKETIKFHEFPEQTQSKLINESPEATKRMLAVEGFGAKQAEAFVTYSPKTRTQISGLSDEAAVSLLDQGLDENLLAVTLTEENLKASDPSKVPATVKPASTDRGTLALGEQLMNSGNSQVMDELKSQSNGTLSEESIKVAETADLLLGDYQLSGANGAAMTLLDGTKVLSNPFYREISSLYQELESDQLVAGEAGFASGRNLIVSANVQALAPYVAGGANRRTLVLSASEKLTFEGDLSWSNKPEHAARLVVMSAGEMTFAKGMTLKSATSDLVIASQKNLVIDGVSMEISQEAAIRGMRDVSLNNVGIGANSMATIKAARNLNVDGLTFSRGVSSILMEATTIRLSNVNFPLSSAVRLNSLKGPLDGKYPNFGSAIPTAQQIGRVNFMKNVSSGGNALNTRQAFDQYGKNISIGKIANP
jgi:hypothetical protein